ncbi:MAG: LysR family transcriptional regulator [Pseudomonadota bacterium]
MHINYDFADLEAFLAVKETGSFHMAAQRLALSQSSVTRRVQKLEQALDSVLFERTTRRVRPTLAAKRLHARAEAMLEDARETVGAMRDESVAFAHQRSLVVTLATIPTVVANLVTPALGSFRAAGHRSRIRILDHAANAVSEAVAQGEADFGICSISSLEPNTGFEHLFDDRIVLAVRDDHPLAAQDMISWRSLEEQDLILPARGTGNRTLIDEEIARMQGALTWTMEAERSSTALALVSGGAGVALLPLSALRALCPDRVSWRPLSDPVISRPVGLVSRNGQTDTPPIAALKHAIRSARHAPPFGTWLTAGES